MIVLSYDRARPMPISLTSIDEPLSVRRSLNDASHDVREATLRQASDIAAPVYQEWKGQLKPVGLTWQAFQSAASMNHEAWRGWLRGELSWRAALEQFVHQLNQKIEDSPLRLAD
jgi:hypothetical protein